MGGICLNCIKNNKNYGANPSKIHFIFDLFKEENILKKL